uniref:type ISP restriction/modification enzyme n=1 Tax=Pseudomonas aeruginosa TaxID=287 RepID=UPI000A7392EC
PLGTAERRVTRATYRPFAPSYVCFDKELNDATYSLPRMFPSEVVSNWGFYTTGIGATKPFAALMVKDLPDVNLWGSEGGQFFPRYTYEEREADDSLLAALEEGDGPHRRIDNVTDDILTDYQKTFGPEVTKDEIFFYVYGVLHSTDYRQQFAADLKKMLPRIPKVKSFRAFADAGQKLADLHLGYETVNPYPVTEKIAPGASLRVEKMRYLKRGRETDKTTIIYNSGITISGIPLEAQE